MDDLLVLRVSMQENNYKGCSDVDNSGLEVSFWYWMEHNCKYDEAIKKFSTKLL